MNPNHPRSQLRHTRILSFFSDFYRNPRLWDCMWSLRFFRKSQVPKNRSVEGLLRRWGRRTKSSVAIPNAYYNIFLGVSGVFQTFLLEIIWFINILYPLFPFTPKMTVGCYVVVKILPENDACASFGEYFFVCIIPCETK